MDYTDLKDYLDGYHQYDGYAMAICPFHSDSSPSLRISSRGYFCLSNCEARGSVEKLFNHLSGRPAIKSKWIPNPSAWIWHKWIDNFGTIKVVCQVAHANLSNTPDLGEYLYSRKFSEKNIRDGFLGYLDGYYTFPIKDNDGIIQGAVARASPTIQSKANRYSVMPNCMTKLYLPDYKDWKGEDPIHLPFGTVDAWTLKNCGYRSMTGISGQELRADHLKQFRVPIYIIPDKGEERRALLLQSQMDWRGMPLYINWPDGTKDLNDIERLYGKELVIEKIEKAKERYKYD